MISKENFLEGLKIQFEDSDARKLTMDTQFSSLDTWDSLTRFSIIAFVEDEFKLTIEGAELNKFSTPLELFNFITVQ
jgi:acyl carrier protein